MHISPISQTQVVTFERKIKDLFSKKSSSEKRNPNDTRLPRTNIPIHAIEKKSIEDRKTERWIEKNMTPEANNIYERSKLIAQYSHSPELECWHMYLATLQELKEYLQRIDDGKTKFENESRFKTALSIDNFLSKTESIFADNTYRTKIEKEINSEIASMQKDFVEKDQERYSSRHFGTPTMSKKAITDLGEQYDKLADLADTDIFHDNYFLFTALYSRDDNLKKHAEDFQLRLRNAVFLETSFTKDKNHIEFYDNKADIIWKNITHGNSVLVINDGRNKQSYEYLLNSFFNLIHEPNRKYDKLSPENVEFVKINDKADSIYLEDLIRHIQSDKTKKGKTVIILGNIDSILKNSNCNIMMSLINLLQQPNQKESNQPNIKFIMTITPESFHLNKDNDGPFTNVLESYAQQSLPILNDTDTSVYLTNESGLAFIKSRIQKPVTKEAVLHAIKLTSSKDGNYPDKVIDLLSTVGKYFIDSESITINEIDKYLKDTEDLSEATTSTERTIILDTGKKLDDIKGMPMTKAQAEKLAQKIKRGTMGTRGVIVSHNNGTAYGGGRRYTVESIAGEVGVPIIAINAKDFALKDIDALSQQASLSELKIKKIISTAKAQAEANQQNTAIIFIENFDNFASNSLYGISSIYEQKAFSQLMTEMDNARKSGKINLVVMGSMNMPETIDENILKPYKFLDQLIIYQPQDNRQRREIIDYYIKEKNLTVAGNTPEARESILQNVSESTAGFTVVDLMYLLDTAKDVSMEREKEAIDLADFTEAYLQTTTGITNTMHTSEAEKKIVASHEAGHALDLQIMYEIAQKQNIPWHLPSQVNFITLDPRGDYGGAMYPKESDNNEMCFEKVMADIICDYGGHSSENIIYNIQGSWGISCDMQMAANSAELAVRMMGMGAQTGVRYTPVNEAMSEAKKEMIEADIDNITTTAKNISDSIITEYKDFILEFTEKYYKKVGTGECLISGDEFRQLLNDWREKQTPEKKKALIQLEEKIVKDVEHCKHAQEKK